MVVGLCSLEVEPAAAKPGSLALQLPRSGLFWDGIEAPQGEGWLQQAGRSRGARGKRKQPSATSSTAVPDASKPSKNKKAQITIHSEEGALVLAFVQGKPSCPKKKEGKMGV